MGAQMIDRRIKNSRMGMSMQPLFRHASEGEGMIKMIVTWDET